MMKHVTYLPDGSRLEVDGSNVKHISEYGKVLYDSSTILPHQKWPDISDDDYDDNDWS